MEDIENALKVYASNPEGMGCAPKLVESLRMMMDISNFVRQLSYSQLEGRYPVLSVMDRQDGTGLVRLSLYWNPEHKSLVFDWSDTNLWL